MARFLGLFPLLFQWFHLSKFGLTTHPRRQGYDVMHNAKVFKANYIISVLDNFSWFYTKTISVYGRLNNCFKY